MPPFVKYSQPVHESDALGAPKALRAPAMRRAAAASARAGFSLVEVVLALGIIAFAFVPMVGMLPLGLDFSRQAIDTTVGAQIAQQLTTEAQQTDFSQLSEFADATVASPFYFDDQGNKTTDAPGAIYEAVLSLAPNTVLPDNVTTQKLATLTVCILNTKATRTNREADLRKNPDSRKITALIPDNGR